MAKEIERKFLVMDDSYKSSPHTRIRQGYLSSEPARTVRVRIKGDRGFLTVKGLTCGATREEFEYEIPICDAEAMICLCDPDSFAGREVTGDERYYNSALACATKLPPLK